MKDIRTQNDIWELLAHIQFIIFMLIENKEFLSSGFYIKDQLARLVFDNNRTQMIPCESLKFLPQNHFNSVSGFTSLIVQRISTNSGKSSFIKVHVMAMFASFSSETPLKNLPTFACSNGSKNSSQLSIHPNFTIESLWTQNLNYEDITMFPVYAETMVPFFIGLVANTPSGAVVPFNHETSAILKAAFCSFFIEFRMVFEWESGMRPILMDISLDDAFPVHTM